MIYKILKHSLPCLSACQECHSVYPWGGKLLCLPRRVFHGRCLDNGEHPEACQFSWNVDLTLSVKAAG